MSSCIHGCKTLKCNITGSLHDTECKRAGIKMKKKKEKKFKVNSFDWQTLVMFYILIQSFAETVGK